MLIRFANNQAMAAKGKYFCWINPDAIVREDTLLKMLSSLIKLLS